ncbi:MAG: ATP-grasp domain-containing protein [Planctomycetes bacterium]|nr:ATP-grasp domain-containing protein [Planctomycetota bacterium]
MELSAFPLEHAELLHVENAFWVLSAPTGVGNYDFRFDQFFRCARPWQPPDNITAVARLGAFPSYESVYDALRTEGTTLVHSPEEYRRATELPCWYPLIEDLTPASHWFPSFPDLEEVTSRLSWPIFMKGTRQTSRHRRELSIIDGPEQFRRILDTYATDPILRSQGVVCRQFVPLRLVEESDPNRLPSAFEFRTFWWKGSLVGCGRYWWEGKFYRMTQDEERACLAIAQETARRVRVPFLVVDVAQAADGKWIVIECNDGQESGLGGVSPVALWQKIIDIERAN